MNTGETNVTTESNGYTFEGNDDGSVFISLPVLDEYRQGVVDGVMNDGKVRCYFDVSAATDLMLWLNEWLEQVSRNAPSPIKYANDRRRAALYGEQP